jgi:hypothetical protein
VSRFDKNFPSSSAQRYFADQIAACPKGFDPDSRCVEHFTLISIPISSSLYRESKCNPQDFDKSSSQRGWTFYPTRMMPDFSINVAGQQQSVMFFDAATCASVVTKIDVRDAPSFIASKLNCEQVMSTGEANILTPIISNVTFVIAAIFSMYIRSFTAAFFLFYQHTFQLHDFCLLPAQAFTNSKRFSRWRGTHFPF